jgi:hypothetical protein
MLPPRLPFRGDESSAEARLENTAGDLGLSIVCRIVEQNTFDRRRLVDEEPAASEHLSLDDVAFVSFSGIGSDHVVA